MIDNSNQNSNIEHHLDQAYFYYEETEAFEEALLECEAALEIDPYSLEAHNLRGIILEELGRIFEAREAYQQAIFFDPNFIEAKENLSALDAELARQEHLVTIATFSYPTEAYVPKTKLDAAEVWSFVADENTVIMNWLYSNAIGGVKLQVKRRDIELAYEILADEKPVAENNFDEEDNNDTCPNCHSMNIYPKRYNMRLIFGFWFLSWLFLTFFTGFNNVGFTLPFFRREWKCGECNYQWKDETG